MSTLTAIPEQRAVFRADRKVGSGVARPLVAITVVLLPILRPAGPGNTAAADAFMALALAALAAWVVRTRLPAQFPYLPGVSLLVLGGALAAVLAGNPLSSALVLAQDILLLAWGIALAMGSHDVGLVRVALRAWCYTAVTLGIVFVLSYLVGFSAVSGVTAKDGVRASYTFDDPNLAANYLVVSLFVVMAAGIPRTRAARWPAALVILVAIGFTGSNGAAVSLVVGSAAALAFGVRHVRGPLVGLLVFLGLVVAGLGGTAVVKNYVDVGAIRDAAAGSIPLLRDSVGRSNSSQAERVLILHEGLDLYFRGDALGVGPARTKYALAAEQAPYVKEAHNDYLAALLERGAIGVMGLVLLGIGIWRRSATVVSADVTGRAARLLRRPGAFVAIGPVMAISAGFYEVLHFRHFWTWLGLLAALAALERKGA